jgi:hypothetical protein
MALIEAISDEPSFALDMVREPGTERGCLLLMLLFPGSGKVAYLKTLERTFQLKHNTFLSLDNPFG